MNRSTEVSLSSTPGRLRLPLLPGMALAGFMTAILAVGVIALFSPPRSFALPQIVQQIAEAHHGTIGVDSKPASGTVFTVQIPRRLAEYVRL